MKKILILIILILVPSCKQPASKVSVIKLNNDFYELVKHVKYLEKLVLAGSNIPIELKQKIKDNSDKILIEAEKNTKADVGIWDWDWESFRFIAGKLIEVGLEVGSGFIQSNPYTAMALGIINSLLVTHGTGKLLANRREKKKLKKDKLIAERHKPENIDIHKAIVASVDADIKSGKVKV